MIAPSDQVLSVEMFGWESPAVFMKREQHREKTIELLKQLKNDSMFTDVTLASEDGINIKAHRAIIGYSSPYMFSILQVHKESDGPLVLPVKYKQLYSLLEYIYLGESKVDIIEVNNFLRMGNNLQIRGLWNGQNIKPCIQIEKTSWG